MLYALKGILSSLYVMTVRKCLYAHFHDCLLFQVFVLSITASGNWNAMDSLFYEYTKTEEKASLVCVPKSLGCYSHSVKNSTAFSTYTFGVCRSFTCSIRSFYLFYPQNFLVSVRKC